MIACMVPKGNMMHCMVRETDEGLKQLKYSITGKEIPVEIMEMETIMSAFFEGEIKDIKREGIQFCIALIVSQFYFRR